MGITTDIGNNYETVAAEFLTKLGYKIIEKNYRKITVSNILIFRLQYGYITKRLE